MAEIVAAVEKKIKSIVNRINNLPTPPIVFAQVNKVLNDPDTSAYQIGAILSEDPALSAKILKLTNSAFYGLPRAVTSVKQAIVILGLDAVKSLVLSASVFETFARHYKIDRAYLDGFWRHSLSVAFMSRILSRTKDFPSILEAEESFSAGLLHDIGRLVIFAHLPEEFKEITKVAGDLHGSALAKIEEEILGFDHASVGGFLCLKWNLPQSLSEAILNHHQPENTPDNMTTHIIHVADYLAWKAEPSNSSDDNSSSRLPELCRLSYDNLGLEDEREKELIEKLQSEYSKAETFLKMAQGA